MKIKQLSVFVENKTGRINEVTQILGSKRCEYDGIQSGRQR